MDADPAGARALASGDALGAFNDIALRDDPVMHWQGADVGTLKLSARLDVARHPLNLSIAPRSRFADAPAPAISLSFRAFTSVGWVGPCPPAFIVVRSGHGRASASFKGHVRDASAKAWRCPYVRTENSRPAAAKGARPFGGAAPDPTRQVGVGTMPDGGSPIVALARSVPPTVFWHFHRRPRAFGYSLIPIERRNVYQEPAKMGICVTEPLRWGDISYPTGGPQRRTTIMLTILMKGTQVWQKGSALTSPWHVVGQGRHGIICRRSEGGNVITRCFKPDELQRADDAVSPSPFVHGDLVEGAPAPGA